MHPVSSALPAFTLRGYVPEPDIRRCSALGELAQPIRSEHCELRCWPIAQDACVLLGTPAPCIGTMSITAHGADKQSAWQGNAASPRMGVVPGLILSHTKLAEGRCRNLGYVTKYLGVVCAFLDIGWPRAPRVWPCLCALTHASRSRQQPPLALQNPIIRCARCRYYGQRLAQGRLHTLRMFLRPIVPAE